MNRVLMIVGIAPMLAAASTAPHKLVRKTDALDFRFEWPGEAAAIPKLDLQLYNEAKRDLAQAQKNAQEDQTAARQQKREFHQHSFSLQWRSVGNGPRLLSLTNQLGTFTGGAHPNTSFGSLLWDRRSGKEIAVSALFLRSEAFGAVMRARYCAALAAERTKRRQRDKLGGEFDQCPKFGDLAIAPVDRNNNKRLDTIDFIASPYTAGPYAEGEYEISLPVTSELIRGIRPEYRDSFERQRQ
ncbi:MAG: PdaC/SigV domain-containing protein [Sphingomicrobium sp.]